MVDRNSLSSVQPRPELKRYVKSIWILESEVGLPSGTGHSFAPNGCPKLIVPYKNSLVRIANGSVQVGKEGSAYVAGIRDSAAIIKTTPQRTGVLGIEFHPAGAYPVWGISMNEMANAFLDSEEAFGRWGRLFQDALCHVESTARKVDFVQDQLVGLLTRHSQNETVAFCVRTLELSHGRVAVKDLERLTGYSRRHLDQLFNTHVGCPPKVLARVLRFHRFYEKWARGEPYHAFKDELYDHYCDQSHFSNDFKKMTGYPPKGFALQGFSEFARRVALR